MPKLLAGARSHLVSTLELACTGQVHLPILSYVHRISTGPRTIALIVLYNLAFVLPLVLVLIVGVRAGDMRPLQRWAARHARAARAALGTLVLAPGIHLIWIAAT